MFQSFFTMGGRSQRGAAIVARKASRAREADGPARFAVLVALVLAASFGAEIRSAWGLEIEDVQWGFDGKTVVNTFTPISILVSNPTPDAFDGRMKLERIVGTGVRSGAPLEEAVYLAPYTSRWVQFYPYLIRHADEWVLKWGRGAKEQLELPSPTYGETAQVLLEPPRALPDRGGGVKRFPADLFPPMVTATDALESVILDHAPRWEEARRQAFLDWIFRGGVVHLLQESNGEFPTFSGSLTALNSPLEVQQIGNGWVFRHSWTRSRLDTRTAVWLRAYQQSWISSRTALWDLSEPPPDGSVPLPETGSKSVAAGVSNPVVGQHAIGEVDDVIHSQLKDLTYPDHNWELIHLLSWMYFALIFPGCYALARRRLDYRMIFLAFVVLVGTFSVAFAAVGKRGYGEATTVHALAIARPLPDGHYDVTQWSNAFVTDGDIYTITHAGNGQLYSTAQIFEAVPGAIDNGLNGAFHVDIPPFSSRTMLHRAKVPGRTLELSVEHWNFNADPPQLELTVHGELPSELRWTYAIHGDRMYALHRQSNRLTLGRSIRNVSAFLESNQPQIRWGGSAWNAPRQQVSMQQCFDSLFEYALSLSFGDHGHPQRDDFEVPPDRVRIVLYAPMSDDFFIQNEQFRKQLGYVLYVVDVYAPEIP